MNKILRYLDCVDKEVSLLLVDNRTIKELNNAYLGKNYPTNVLSFSLTEGKFGHLNPAILGDIVISAEQALSDADKSRMNLSDHLDFLMIHGVLHLLGYDHEGSATEKETVRMEKKERELFFRLHGYWAHRFR